jgi:hypothetical protein
MNYSSLCIDGFGYFMNSIVIAFFPSQYFHMCVYIYIYSLLNLGQTTDQCRIEVVTTGNLFCSYLRGSLSKNHLYKWCLC